MPKKIGNHDIATNNQQDLITTLSRLRALKIDFACAESRMGDLFVSGLVLLKSNLRNKTSKLHTNDIRNVHK